MPALDLAPRYLAMVRDILARHAPGAQVWAYGSRVTGGAHAGSDLDLVVLDPVHPDRPSPATALVRAALRESALPILSDVLDWARLPDAFRDEIRRAHVVLSGA